MTDNKYTFTFTMPNKMKNEISERVMKDGYGTRGKSRWICEAIDRFLDLENFFELIEHADKMRNFDRIEATKVNYVLKKKIEHAVLKIRKRRPLMEGVRSKIMRAAVLQRILRG